jgi:hypothetical protein
VRDRDGRDDRDDRDDGQQLDQGESSNREGNVDALRQRCCNGR